jgi:MinD-like ATPase involved in chromosome partitioning or flagellar assembly
MDEPNSDVSQAVRHLAAKFTGQFGSVAETNGEIKAAKKRKIFSRT